MILLAPIDIVVVSKPPTPTVADDNSELSRFDRGWLPGPIAAERFACGLTLTNVQHLSTSFKFQLPL
ncbi:hypothetical protein J6590_023707 [Homalodisca vitripennis]|nr:hypothetical protein J6590_023707 [Homalodisca vitripennis]